MSIEKIPAFRAPYVATPARREVWERARTHLRREIAARRHPLGSRWLEESDIGNANPTIDRRLALLAGMNAVDAPHGYSAFWSS